MTRKILGTSAPAATTWATLYTCPAEAHAEGETLTVCNRGGSTESFRVSVNVGGAAADGDTAAEYIYYDVDVATKDAFLRDFPVPLNDGDKVWVYASGANLTFTLTGSVGRS
tara:strand:+ start:905 stop:1240 length:336 start_codon:yes stop_codon:yes gene_type:complete